MVTEVLGKKTLPTVYVCNNQCTVVYYGEIGLLINIVLKIWGPLGDILLIWGGRRWYFKHFVKFLGLSLFAVCL